MNASTPRSPAVRWTQKSNLTEKSQKEKQQENTVDSIVELCPWLWQKSQQSPRDVEHNARDQQKNNEGDEK